MTKLDRFDILSYAMTKGVEAAANLLLLVGPDGYAGNYESYKALEALLNNEPNEGVNQ